MKKSSNYDDQLKQFCNSYNNKSNQIKNKKLETEESIKKFLLKPASKLNIFIFCFHMQSKDNEESGLKWYTILLEMMQNYQLIINRDLFDIILTFCIALRIPVNKIYNEASDNTLLNVLINEKIFEKYMEFGQTSVSHTKNGITYYDLLTSKKNIYEDMGTRTVFSGINDEIIKPNNSEPYKIIIDWLRDEDNQARIRGFSDKRLTVLKKIIRLFLLSLSDNEREKFLIGNTQDDWKSRRISLEKMSLFVLGEQTSTKNYITKHELMENIFNEITLEPENINDIWKNMNNNFIENGDQSCADQIVFEFFLSIQSHDTIQKIKKILFSTYPTKDGYEESGSMIIYRKPPSESDYEKSESDPKKYRFIDYLSPTPNIHLLLISKIRDYFSDCEHNGYTDTELYKAIMGKRNLDSEGIIRSTSPSHRKLQKALSGTIVLTQDTFSEYVQAIFNYCESHEVNTQYLREMKMVYNTFNKR